MKICVVGGGTAGFIAATILKKFLDAEVTLVYSSKVGIVGVGEGSTEHFAEYMRFVGMDQYSIIKECDATYKAGIYFDGWTDKPYMHYVGPPFNDRVAQYSFVYGHQIARGDDMLVPNSVMNSEMNKLFLNQRDYPPFNQFHFNTHKLNKYLQNFSENMGIRVVDDEIIDVSVEPSGNILSVIGEKDSYEADFFIDATGFKKLLISKIGYEWKSFRDFLKMKSAVGFPTENKNYNMYTTAKALDYGWMFNIPVWERQGNGYIFDSDYISMDQAKEEITKIFGDVDFGKEFSFDAGYVKNPWVNNCVAVGLSSAFVEPLEATSIGTTIQQSFILMHKLPNYSKGDINQYNKTFQSIMDNIRDFIFLHYMTKKENTQFWKDAASIDPPDSLREKLEMWQRRLPTYQDFSFESNYGLFRDSNFTVVLAALKMFDQDAIKKEYMVRAKEMHEGAEQRIAVHLANEEGIEKFTHKDMIRLIREIA